MSTAIPTMTSMVATAPMASYGASPAMTSMYMPTATMVAPATTVMAAPATTSMAAPVTYAAPTTFASPTGAAPSYVTAPQTVVSAAPVGFPQFAVPAPMSLTAGLAPPEKVDEERAAYSKALQGQLDKQVHAVLEEAKIKKAMLQQQATTQLEQYKLQLEENRRMGELQCDQEALGMISGLKEAAITQQTAREEVAAIAVADYRKKKALEEMSAKSYQLQKQWHDSEAKLMGEYQQVMMKGARQ